MTERMFMAGYVGNGTFIVYGRHLRTVDSMCKRGDRYIIEIYEPRNAKWEKKFFAVVATAWANLPHDIQEQFSTPDELRKWALIQTGHFHERQGIMKNNAEALRYMGTPRPPEDYVLFSVNGAAVVERRPRSMRRDSMNREDFDRAANDVIGYLAKLLGVTQIELESSHRGDKLHPSLAIAGDTETDPASQAGGALALPASPKSEGGASRLEALAPPADGPHPSIQHPDDHPIWLTADEAISILWNNSKAMADDGKGPDVHNISFRGTGFGFGANWTRGEAIALIRSASALSLFDRLRSHELLVFEHSGRRSLFETDGGKVDALRKEKTGR